MARIITPPIYIGLDNDAGRNGEPPSAARLASVIQSLNSIGARQPRLLFCQHHADETVTGSPLLRLRYNNNWPNGRAIRHSATILPPYITTPVSGDATPTFTGIEGGVSESWARADTRNEPADLIAMSLDETPAAPTNAYRAVTMATAGTAPRAYRLVSVAVYEQGSPRIEEVDTLWTTGGNGPLAIDPQRLTAGDVVLDDLFNDVFGAMVASWNTQRPIVAAWSSQGNNGRRVLTDTNTLTNLIDLASVTRETWTPGEICPSTYAASGLDTVVGATVAVYAESVDSGGNAQVSFQSSVNTVAIAGIGAAGWYTSARAALSLDTRAVNGDVRDVDKVDIFGATSGATPGRVLRVYAWMIQVDANL